MLICSTLKLFLLHKSYAIPTKLVDPVFGTLLYIMTVWSALFRGNWRDSVNPIPGWANLISENY